MFNVFPNTDDKDEMYPVTESEIAVNQHLDKALKTFFSKEDPKGRIICRVIDDVDILVYDNKYMCISGYLTDQVVRGIITTSNVLVTHNGRRLQSILCTGI